MSELLIEIFSEEIPARMQENAAQGFMTLITAGLEKAGLSFTGAECFSTPRRLSVCINGIPSARAASIEEIKGPRVDAADAAIAGFLKKNGLTSRDSCVVKNIDDVSYYIAQKKSAGGQTIDQLGAIIESALSNMAWPKSMRWGTSRMRWVRPLHNVLALYNGAVIPGGVSLSETQRLTFNNETWGHRFLSDGRPIVVKNFSDYQEKLYAASVILSPVTRREKIWKDVQACAAAQGFSVKEDPKLLNEVTGLVEWPVPFMGAFDEEFLSIPAEVISTSMREHQRYFSVLGPNGKLINRFICVANIAPNDNGRTIIYGNEKVLRARLSDARFFWELDQKTKLADLLPRLEGIRFHEKLGTVAEKSKRIESLACHIADQIGASPDRAARAGLLSKADLVTGMVREFPELQGVMGGYYARLSGEGDDVAEAISTHYAPVGPHDRCPRAPVSVAVAMADKIDTLVGFFSIGEKPTGNKDPFALRRAALSVIRLILENDLSLDLQTLLKTANLAYQKSDIPAGLLDFIRDRFRVTLIDAGFSHKVIDAVFAAVPFTDLRMIRMRIVDLSGFMGTTEGQAVLAAMKRAGNILDAAKITAPFPERRMDLLRLPEEKMLDEAIQARTAAYTQALKTHDHAKAFLLLHEIAPCLQKFFDGVMVMDQEIEVRHNRLALVALAHQLFAQIADARVLSA